ncbi:HPr(Ser) kinase/phosphatase [Azonexus hydrophilus]|uniref:HPr(Ser) kinase/phosphatase n=1 Tax=Azonexus hydrophilus TaxID=418702 RepID=UPI001964FB11|nr:HPr(Ser) kinase/phosphatase [Azonexus hydrophilus]
MRTLSLDQLFEDNRETLLLNWLFGHSTDRKVELKAASAYGADVVGHINVIHPERLQVVGQAEHEWALRIGERRFTQLFNELLAASAPAVIVADGLKPPDFMVKACLDANVPLILSPKHCSAVIDQLRIYLSAKLADTISMHGVFMDVLGMGVLITGDSGAGKSELALELISRGHGLVADDVVEMARVTPSTIEGRCPGMLRDFLEVRGLGLLNIRTIFGETASRLKMRLKLIVHLQRPHNAAEAPRLPLDAQTQDILGVPIRKVVIPVAAGRNLAVLLEAAVRNTILQFRGIDSMQDFIARQSRCMQADSAD